jgi:hypothetical protein
VGSNDRVPTPLPIVGQIWRLKTTPEQIWGATTTPWSPCDKFV